jgi:hypothetical protein
MLVLAHGLCNGNASSQVVLHSNYIHVFNKTNNIKSISGLARTAFQFTHLTNDQMLNMLRIEANSSAFAGFNLNYKGYRRSMTGTYLILLLTTTTAKPG